MNPIVHRSSFIVLRFNPSRSFYSGSKRYVVLRALLRVSNLLNELIEMRRRVHEVDVVRVHHQQWRLLVPVKVVGVRLTELLQILGRDRLLVSPPAPLDAPQQCIKVALEVDDEVGFRYGLEQQVIEPVVDHELGVVERQVREELVFRKGVVGEEQLREEIALGNRPLLVVPGQEKEELAAEGG